MWKVLLCFSAFPCRTSTKKGINGEFTLPWRLQASGRYAMVMQRQCCGRKAVSILSYSYSPWNTTTTLRLSWNMNNGWPGFLEILEKKSIKRLFKVRVYLFQRKNEDASRNHKKEEVKWYQHHKPPAVTFPSIHLISYRPGPVAWNEVTQENAKNWPLVDHKKLQSFCLLVN